MVRDDLQVEELGGLTTAYWRYHQLARGTREQRLASEEHVWALLEVADCVDGDPDRAVVVIDALLNHPDAVAPTVGCGPLEDLLLAAPQSAVEVGRRCSADPLWREAASYVVLADPVPDAVAVYVAKRPE